MASTVSPFLTSLNRMRDDLEKLKKVRCHRGLRHMWGLRVRGFFSGSRMAQADLPIGIAFGTNYSCVAVWQGDHAEVIANEQGNRSTPCCVAFTELEELVGEPAFNQLVKSPQSVAYQVRKVLGQAPQEVSAASGAWVSNTRENDGKSIIVIDHGGEEKEFLPEDIAAKVLKAIKETAEAFLGSKVTKSVIAIPTSFGPAQRQAVQSSASKAGLDVIRLIHEPTAAALAYGLDVPSDTVPKNIVVFDFGASTLEVTVLRADRGLFETLATTSDPSLGGDIIDDLLVDHFQKEFKRKHKSDLRENKRSMRRLRVACEKAKRVLSSSVQTVLEADSLFEGIDFFASISRGRFEELISDLLKRCAPVLDEALQTANLEKEAVAEVILAGGSSRIPKVAATVTNYFGPVPVRNTIAPEEAVACGAATQAFVLSGMKARYAEARYARDLTALTIGVEAADGTMATVIPRNTSVPCSIPLVTSTSAAHQRAVYLKVYEGERLTARDNTLLGTLALRGLTDGPAGTAKVEVTFVIDEAGALTVRATEAASGATAELVVPGGDTRLSHAEIDRSVGAGLLDRKPPPASPVSPASPLSPYTPASPTSGPASPTSADEAEDGDMD